MRRMSQQQYASPYTYVPEFTLGDRLRRAREAQGLSQRDLAERIGFSQRTVSNYENMETTPRGLELVAWANECQCDLSWLAYGDRGRGPFNPAEWNSRRRNTRGVTPWSPRTSWLVQDDDSTLVTAA
jgi:transcriptional regulator with XRE-family HTH domain